MNTLKAINNLESDKLAVGQLLNVPSGLSNVNTYVVSAGDTLYSVAKKFSVSVDEIKDANNLTNNLLKVGQKLIIHKDEDLTYVVKAGDTLYSIARKYNITVDKLKELNNLTNNNLSIGQILIVGEA